MIPVILYASFWMGALVFRENRGDLSLSELDNLDVIQTNVYQYTVGAIVLSFVAAILIGLVSYILLRWNTKRKKPS